MADDASGSGAGPSKAIASLAKKTAEVTRLGTQKLKFTPVLPARRKKEEVKAEPTPDTIPPDSSRGRGHGRGRGDGRGRGRGAPRAPVEMTASGPFAMGPTMAGNNARRSVPRSNFAIPNPTSDRSSLGAGLTRLPSTKKENDLKGKDKDKPPEEEEVYSDPDEGVEIIDMEDVRQMDWMAPESIKKERRHAKKKVKKEEPTDVAPGPAVEVEVDAANALDLSESEEEEEFEDLIEHFAQHEIVSEDPALREERLYFFQFPSPFPTFLPPPPPPVIPDPDVVPEVADSNVKRVSFADDVKPESLPSPSKGPVMPSETSAAGKAEESSAIDGVIGTLEVYRSGAVKMRLQNGILLDVTAATQPSFLQHAVCLDLPERRLTILGEVNKRFVVSPDIDSLLTALEISERSPVGFPGEEGLIKMDTT
ncbi:RNA polymerase III RPC4-domain-containing protein [Mycena belliarum]|uniref:RNA polymerase III RPC4-domain-containing protein n=1 Tax=Mycena belliarum TaxID=1033014 RepID=A0AAD6XKQ0_9AGAR|nr:RNA polymerase III RPC4-domain-containing protein [Mycena belliae]